MMNKCKVSLEFSSYPDSEFDAFAGKVLSGLTKNEKLPNPPVSTADLGGLVAGFHGALQAALQGGLQFTAAKNNAREALDQALRQQAHYVESLASQNLETLLSSGFFAVNGVRRGSVPLTKPLVALVDGVGSTRLRVKLGRVPGARTYQVQSNVEGNGNWQDAGMYMNTRGIVLENLTPGKVYSVRVRAFGGSTGTSDWSDPVTKMAT